MIPTDPHSAVTYEDEFECSSEEEFSDEVEGSSVDSGISINYKKIKSLRNARELALLSEKKWILRALSSIRKQRNALKVESLYYQSHKANLFGKHAKQFGGQSLTQQPAPESEGYNLEMEPVAEGNYFDIEIDSYPQNGENLPPSNIEDFNIMEEQCNEQELKNLNMLVLKNQEQWDEDDQEYESDEEPWQEVNLDMSMLVGMDEEPDADIIIPKPRRRV